MKNNLLQKNIPKDWRRLKISDVASVYSGATPKTAEDAYWNGEVCWVTPKDLSHLDSRFISNSERKITELGLKSCSASLIPKNSLVMSSRAPIGYLAINTIPVATNQGCKTMTPKRDLDVNYLYYYLDKNIDLVKRLGTGSTFAEVGRSAVESVEVLVPALTEQKKIAEILGSVDDEIKKTEEIISATEKLKSGLMRRMFASKGVNIKLGEIASIVRGGSPRPIEEYITDEPDGLNWLKIGDIEQGAKYITHTSQKIKQAGLKKTTMVHSGDFILSNSMSFGRPYIMKIDACIHDGWLAFKDVKTNLIDSEFLYYLLSSELLQKNFTAVAAGSGVKNLKRESVSNIVVKLPSLDKQKEITRILSSVDDKVIVHKKIRSNLLLLKKGLMQDLLTGKVRTI